jgi:hypothetical protein
MFVGVWDIGEHIKRKSYWLSSIVFAYASTFNDILVHFRIYRNSRINTSDIEVYQTCFSQG